MDRRKFLGMLGSAPVVLKVTPLLKFLPEAPVVATISQYSDFVTFGSMAEETAIDPIVEAAILKMGRLHALRIDNLVAQEFERGMYGHQET